MSEDEPRWFTSAPLRSIEPLRLYAPTGGVGVGTRSCRYDANEDETNPGCAPEFVPPTSSAGPRPVSARSSPRPSPTEGGMIAAMRGENVQPRAPRE